MTAPRLVLSLQGGGALGATQLGAFRAMVEHGLQPDVVAGISIGAVNAALIAGNRPTQRLRAMETFWRTISWPGTGWYRGLVGPMRSWLNLQAVSQAALFGQPGFFTPNLSMKQRGLYSLAPMRRTLRRLIDWQYLNSSDAPGVSIGAVRRRDGRLHFFDNQHGALSLDHVEASGALSPGFSGVRLTDDELYIDGGSVDGSPIDGALSLEDDRPTWVLAVDLCSRWTAPQRALRDAQPIDVAEHHQMLVEGLRVRRGGRGAPIWIQPVTVDVSLMRFKTGLSDFSQATIQERAQDGARAMMEALCEGAVERNAFFETAGPGAIGLAVG
ncbi:MAG: patatin-like phospholipase family protein [Myxococcota bacterium]